ncbi:Cholesterol oxidase [compost metagenome]
MGHIFLQSMKRHVLKLLKVQDTDPINIGHEAVEAVDPADFTRKCFLILGMGRDKSDGEIKLRADNQAVVKWKIDKSRYHFDRLHTEMKKIADFVKGVYMDSPLLALNKVISVHPLGGCPMGNNADQGVVSPLGEVFGYKGLHVIDGSILPTSTGTNPSLTIAAIAEYIATTIPHKLKVEEQEKAETDT